MLYYPQHKGRNYFQAEETKLYEKGTPCDFDFKYFLKKYENFS